MATAAMGEVIQHLRRTLLLRDGAGLTDGQLLEAYLSRRDEAALEALVHRHGPMVWCVCRRVLGNQHDAEDAFQPTFLVFVRKAASIASRELLANWLYGVAYQTARKARATAAKRKTRERQVTQMPEPAFEQPKIDDLQPLLDQELSQLSDKYRKVLVMCDLEGMTRKEAARQLRCPEGTVASRLATARSMLAKRLARHGVTVTGGALAAVLSQEMASACVPALVVSSTIKAASLFATGTASTGAISVKVATIAEGVLKNMLLIKLKNITAITVAIVVVIGIGVQLSGHGAVSGQQKESDIRPQVNRGDPGDADLGKDARELQGDWKLIAFEREGSNLLEGLGNAVVTFKGDKMTIRLDSDGEAKKSKFKLIPKESPKGIDVTPEYGVFNGRQIAGIYSLEKGRLRICIIERDDRGRNVKIRPKEFKTEASDGLALITLEKVKRDPLKEKPAKQEKDKEPKQEKNHHKSTRREEDWKKLEGTWVTKYRVGPDKSEIRYSLEMRSSGQDRILTLSAETKHDDGGRSVATFNSAVLLVFAVEEKDRKLYLVVCPKTIPQRREHETNIQYQFNDGKLNLEGALGTAKLSGEWTRLEKKK